MSNPISYVTSGISSFAQGVQNTATKVVSYISPIVAAIAARISQAFQFVLPFLKCTYNFAKSNFGLAALSFSTAIAAIIGAKFADKLWLKAALASAGIAFAAAGGIFLASTGILPSWIVPIQAAS